MADIENQGDVVTVGQTNMSFHQLQDIYNSLTGKTESITTPFLRPYRIKQADLENLHQRIKAACTSYGARVRNESVTVYHTNGYREEYSSFDRFRPYNAANTTPVENITIEYHILVIPAGTTVPKQYRIFINLTSRIGIWEKDAASRAVPFDLVRILGRFSGQVRIEFVDYAAARHFMTQIEEWYEALEFSAEWRILKQLQRFSHWFRPMLATLTAAIVLISTHFAAQRLSPEQFSNVDLFRLLTLLSVAVLAAWFGGRLLGTLLEWAIDRVQPLSFVHLNKGDERCIRKYEKENLRNIILSAGSLIVAIILNVISSLIVQYWFSGGGGL